MPRKRTSKRYDCCACSRRRPIPSGNQGAGNRDAVASGAVAVVAALVATAALLCSVQAAASGGGVYRVWFTDPHAPGPGVSWSEWVHSPGLLEASFDTVYLIAAYRHWQGRPLLEEEIEAFGNIAGRRSPWLARESTATSGLSAQQRWGEARAALGFEPEWFATHRFEAIARSDGTVRYRSWENCLEDAFTQATKTLEHRRSHPDYDEQSLRAWVRAQDQVFANCPGTARGVVTDTAQDAESRAERKEEDELRGAGMPPLASAEAAPLVRFDRQYQRAAALFYAARFEAAAEAFAAIARSSSPYADVARYLVARCWLRYADLATAPDSESPTVAAALRLAMELLRDLAIDEDLAPELRRSAHGLLSLAALRADPPGRLGQLAHAVATGDYGSSPALDPEQALIDLLVLSGERSGAARGLSPITCVDESARQGSALERLSGEGEEMLTWLACVRRPSRQAIHQRTEGAAAPARELWAATALVAVSRPGEVHDVAAMRSLQQVATAAPLVFAPGSPLRTTALVHAARIEQRHGLLDAARARLVALDDSSLPLATRNTVSLLRAELAIDLQAWLGAAILQPVAEGWYDGSGRVWPSTGALRFPLAHTDRAAQVLNRAPAQSLQEVLALARSGGQSGARMPAVTSRALAVRLFLLRALAGERAAALESSAWLERELPQVQETVRGWRRSGEGLRGFWLALLLLRHAELPIELPLLESGSLSNLWCAPQYADGGGASPAPVPVVFQEAFQAQPLPAPSALAALVGPAPATSGEEPTHTGGAVVEWAAGQVFAALERPGASGSQEQLPAAQLAEALHLLVRRTKPSACRNGSVSQRAFAELHRRWPQSSWAKQTPYWYE